MNQPMLQSDTQSAAPVTPPSRNPFRLFGGISRALDFVSGDQFVRAMRGAATGVNVVTTDGAAGRFGVTVSAFASASASPPTVLVCINRRSPVCEAIRKNRIFCVNILSTAQRPVAETFSGYAGHGEPYDFGIGSWSRSSAGSPSLDNSVANFDCTLATAIDVGTHTIFVGHVRSVKHCDRSPLLYADRSYRRACSEI